MSLLFGTGAIAGSAAKGAPGMVLLTPTSITHSGTSASIGANGQVTFTAVTSLSLNGVFSADFDNYVVSLRSLAAASVPNIHLRLRVSGSDASGSDYTRQNLSVDSTSVTATRNTSQTLATIGAAASTAESGTNVSIYGPFLAQPTAMRSLDVTGYLSASIFEDACTHSLSTSYDGCTITTSTSSISGALQVYGVRS